MTSSRVSGVIWSTSVVLVIGKYKCWDLKCEVDLSRVEDEKVAKAGSRVRSSPGAPTGLPVPHRHTGGL